MFQAEEVSKAQDGRRGNFVASENWSHVWGTEERRDRIAEAGALGRDFYFYQFRYFFVDFIEDIFFPQS